MSILPGWATSGGLPPWYQQGGAKGPSNNNPYVKPPVMMNTLPGSGGKPITPARGVARGEGAPAIPPRTGNVSGQAPPNPWLVSQNNTPIYTPGQAQPELSLIDRLMSELGQGKQTQSSNAQTRLDALNTERPTPMTAEQTQYNRTGELNTAMQKAQQWADTGGYSDADLATLRARGVSPLRAVYSNANRQLQRQRALQGGYAPGMLAATARMAREQSEQLSEGMTKVNADIADRVAKGREFGLQNLGNWGTTENSLIAGINQANTLNRQNANQFNAGAANDFGLNRMNLRDKIMDSTMSGERDMMDQAYKLAQLRQQVLENNRQGMLTERNTSRQGSLGWEQMNQQGSQALIDAIMQQYGGNMARRRG